MRRIWRAAPDRHPLVGSPLLSGEHASDLLAFEQLVLAYLLLISSQIYLSATSSLTQEAGTLPFAGAEIN